MKRSIMMGITVLVVAVASGFSLAGIQAMNRSETQEGTQMGLDMVLLADGYTTHDPILITSNADFASQGWPGNGTAENPYLISGFSIAPSDNQNRSIFIQNTDVHFIVSHCYFYGFSYRFGLEMRNVTKGRASDVKCFDYDAIGAFDSSDIAIDGNNVSYIYLTSCERVAIDSNVGNVSIDRSSDVSVMHNADGYISIYESNRTVIRNNTCLWLGSHHTKSKSYSCTIDGNIIVGATYPSRVLSVRLIGLASSIFEDNTVLYADDAIDLESCESVVVANNTVFESDHAIGLSASYNISMTWNVFNAQLGDEAAVYDQTGSNSFDYNWYSNYDGIDENGDGIGDTPYNMSGVLDMHPLMRLRGFELPPRNTTTSSTTTTPATSTATMDGEPIPPLVVTALVAGSISIIVTIITVRMMMKKQLTHQSSS